MRVLLYAWIATSTCLAAGDPCLDLKNSVDSDRERLERLESERAELSVQFSDSVRRDFASQAEGALEEMHRSRALKVAYSRKRLERKILEIREKIAPSARKMCDECLAPDDKARDKYCALSAVAPEGPP